MDNVGRPLWSPFKIKKGRDKPCPYKIINHPDYFRHHHPELSIPTKVGRQETKISWIPVCTGMVYFCTLPRFAGIIASDSGWDRYSQPK